MIRPKKTPYVEIFFSILLSIPLLLVCSKNSPIYPMNDWVDTCCIFTVGKSVKNGTVLYKEIFDHKGPILYFLFSGAALVSEKSFIGVYLLEIFSISGFLFFSMQSLKVLVKDNNIMYSLFPVLALGVLASPAFAHGGSAEELMLLPLSYSLYYFLRLIKDIPVKRYEHILVGMSFAMVFWTKYTMIGLYVGAYLFFLGVCICKRNKTLFTNLLLNVVGFFAITFAVLAYFLYHSALKDLWEVYFYDNIFLYRTKVSILTRAQELYIIGKEVIKDNILFVALACLGFAWMLIKQRKEGIFSVILFGCSAFFVFFGKYYVYYSLILGVYSVFGFYPIIEIANKLLKKDIGKRLKVVGVIVSTTLCLIASFFLSDNTYLLKYSKEDMPQYQFAKIINQKKNPTLLNLYYLDGGFYYAADIAPMNKYFYYSNLPAPGMKEEQKKIVLDGSVDFVVTCQFKMEQVWSEHNCTLLAESEMYYEGNNFKYYLYQTNGQK